ncbi:hypothetical protein OG729_20755 [Streptomyces sp. NBC_00210]|uniref:hypothetical protein n=1 Tax=unclassified Streptomyces TaxID=2593676 RepID=UPI003253CE1D
MGSEPDGFGVGRGPSLDGDVVVARGFLFGDGVSAASGCVDGRAVAGFAALVGAEEAEFVTAGASGCFGRPLSSSGSRAMPVTPAARTSMTKVRVMIRAGRRPRRESGLFDGSPPVSASAAVPVPCASSSAGAAGGPKAAISAQSTASRRLVAAGHSRAVRRQTSRPGMVSS